MTTKLTDVAAPFPRSMPVLLLLLGTMYMTLTLGGAAGAETAMNDSQDYDELRTELSSVDDNVTSDLKADIPGLKGKLIAGFADPIVTALTVAGTWGFDVGYANPGLRRHFQLASYLGPVIVFIGAAWQSYRSIAAVSRVSR